MILVITAVFRISFAVRYSPYLSMLLHHPASRSPKYGSF